MPENRLQDHKKTWSQKKILREVYGSWYKTILKDMKKGPGITIELGAGSGNFKEFKPDVLSSDIEACEWLDMCFDAHHMPFGDLSLSNIVMIDVLHHLSNPVLFISEAVRVLESGGRLVILEPFPSPFSYIIYKKFHPEPYIMGVDYFSKNDIERKDPWDANQAVAYLLFYKYVKKFQKVFGDRLRIVKRKKISCVLYPASGGFENRQMIPDFLIPVFKVLEFLCAPLRWLFAFRCYIVIQKT